MKGNNIITYTKWLDCEGNVAFEEQDQVKVTLKTSETLIGKIDSLDGERVTLSTKIIGDVDIDLDDIEDIVHCE